MADEPLRWHRTAAGWTAGPYEVVRLGRTRYELRRDGVAIAFGAVWWADLVGWL